MLLLNYIGILLIVIFNIIDESEFLILHIIAVDLCIFIENVFMPDIHIIDLVIFLNNILNILVSDTDLWIPICIVSK